ncbi:MAG: hypothetical protein HYS07_07130 [Chlamydiae bacterium]|nr:hypothetical protein [Chlamydiota bacterium]MBI3276916.1 hypothetical protein [Chlamydiota bacterium]
MSPHLFFFLLLLSIAIIGGWVLIINAILEKKKKSQKTYEDPVKKHFEDNPLKIVLQSLKDRLTVLYQCLQCQGKQYEAFPFDEDIFEVFCKTCGLKNFYHVDFLAGLHRPTKKTKSPWPKKWLRNRITTPCLHCKNKEHADFRLTMEVKYKFSGYADKKKMILYFSSCKACGLMNFFDRDRGENHGT